MKTASLCAAGHKLRWCQWRLRSMFALTFFTAIGMSWVAVMIQDGRKQRRAADAIERMGGTVECKPTWLGALLKDDSLINVTHAWVSVQAVTDADLATFQGLTQLQALALNQTRVTDAGLVRLEGLSRLQMLALGGTAITDAGLVHLRGLNHLEMLELGSTQVTDAGLRHLEGLTRLRRLTLNYTHVTDVGLGYLEALTQLEIVTLIHTDVTDQGVRRLQGVLPHCHVIWMPKSCATSLDSSGGR